MKTRFYTQGKEFSSDTKEPHTVVSRSPDGAALLQHLLRERQELCLCVRVQYSQPLHAQNFGNCPTCNKPLSKDRTKLLTWLANGFCAFVIVCALTIVYVVRNPDVYRRFLPTASVPSTPNISLRVPQVSYTTLAHNAQSVTAAQFKKLKVGMNYKQVNKIMGSQGTRTGKTEIAGVPTSMYLWQNPDGSHINVEMRNNKLAFKTNFHIDPK